MNIWTIGHSTRSADDLIDMLQDNQIEAVADVRSYPGSRRYPWFASDSMREWLGDAGVRYEHFRDLGGRRHSQPVEPYVNAAWQSDSFHNYADWTASPEFRSALGHLETLATECRTAFMCSEAMPWRCHRNLLASVLAARGWTVEHIMCTGNRPHVMGQWGPMPVVEDGTVTYPVEHTLAMAV